MDSPYTTDAMVPFRRDWCEDPDAHATRRFFSNFPSQASNNGNGWFSAEAYLPGSHPSHVCERVNSSFSELTLVASSALDLNRIITDGERLHSKFAIPYPSYLIPHRHRSSVAFRAASTTTQTSIDVSNSCAGMLFQAIPNILESRRTDITCRLVSTQVSQI